MIDHITLRVEDYPRLTAFYKQALAALGYEVVMEFPGAVGMGAGGKPDLWITQTDQPVNPIHLAFACQRAQVDAFHAAALAAGGIDHGPPGLRPEYHPHYYGAFALDPEGNNVEAVCHASPDAPAIPTGNRSVGKKPSVKAKAKSKTKVAAKTSTKRPTKAAAKKPAKKPAKKSAKKPGTRPAQKPAKRRR